MEIIYAILIVIVLTTIGMVYDHYRMKRIAVRRGKADICGYARSFEYRNVDTRIIREVFDCVQEWAGVYDGKPFPVQANDCFDDLYRMDPEDLEDIYLEVAHKLCISTEREEDNPYFNQVKNVKELVLFLHHQPKVSNA